MADPIPEIESAVSALEGAAPALSGIVAALVPGAGPAMTLAVPLLSITNEILAAIETLKGTGLAHESAVAVIGQAVSAIGTQLTNAVPAASAVAALPAQATVAK